MSNLVRECKESFGKDIIMDACFSYNGKLKIIRVVKNVKINSAYYPYNIVHPIFTGKISFIYPNIFQWVKLHQDDSQMIPLLYDKISHSWILFFQNCPKLNTFTKNKIGKEGFRDYPRVTFLAAIICYQ